MKGTVKRYRAIASGHAQWNELTVSARIGPVPHALLGTMHAATPHGEPASSHVAEHEQRSAAFLLLAAEQRLHHPLPGHPLVIVGEPPSSLLACARHRR